VASASDEDAPVPSNAKDVLRKILENQGRPPQGFRGGGRFENDGRGGGEILPQTDASGRPISYQEYDISASQPGVNRGAERLVLGSDGSAYYTGNHYLTFTPIY